MKETEFLSYEIYSKLKQKNIAHDDYHEPKEMLNFNVKRKKEFEIANAIFLNQCGSKLMNP